jgi:hypothetical protein
MGDSRKGIILGMWKEVTIEEGKVLRERDPLMAGFITEVVTHGGGSFMRIS